MKKVLFIGGGTGISSLLRDYNNFRNSSLELSAAISVFDTGGSTGLLRKEFKVLPMGDMRQVILSLSKDSVIKKIFNYRFAEKQSIKAHNIGNLIITALIDIDKDERAAFEDFKSLLEVKEKVVPITWAQSHVYAEYESGEYIKGEHNIDSLIEDKKIYGRIKNFGLNPEVDISEDAYKCIVNADYIVIGPGDLYLSIICNFLVKGFQDALSQFKGKIIYLPNLINKRGQTEGFRISDYVNEINKYLKVKQIDTVLYSKNVIPEDILNKYKVFNAYPPIMDLYDKRVKLIDIISSEKVYIDKKDKLFRSFLRHDSKKFFKWLLNEVKA